jgi:hypothetical protein
MPDQLRRQAKRGPDNCPQRPPLACADIHRRCRHASAGVFT